MVNRQLAVLGVGLMAVLGACSPPDDQYDYVESKTPVVKVSSTDANVGEAVTVTVEASLFLDARSRVEERRVTDIAIGACFGDGITADGEGLANGQGFCGKEKGTLPQNYKLLAATDSDYYKPFDDRVIRRGETLELKNVFTFTVTEAQRVVIAPSMTFWDRAFEGFGGGISSVPKNYPAVLFK